MGFHCILIPIREPILMDLSEEEIVTLFRHAGRPANRSNSPQHPKQQRFAATPSDSSPAISLKDMWAEVHQILTGSFGPIESLLSRSIFGGTTLELHEVGAGPVWYLWADEVREIATALAAVTDEELHRRYDPAGLKVGRYRTPVRDDEDEELVFLELQRYFHDLKRFYRLAASRGDAVMIGVV